MVARYRDRLLTLGLLTLAHEPERPAPDERPHEPQS